MQALSNILTCSPSENPIMKLLMWRNENGRCAVYYITPTAATLQVVSGSLYAHTVGFLLRGNAFFFHKALRHSPHTLTKPFPHILITFSSPEIFSLKQPLFIFTCTRVSPSEYPDIMLPLSAEHLLPALTQRQRDTISRPSTMTACHGPDSPGSVLTSQHMSPRALDRTSEQSRCPVTRLQLQAEPEKLGEVCFHIEEYGGDVVMLMWRQPSHTHGIRLNLLLM